MELARRKHATFRTWRKFEIKNTHNVILFVSSGISYVRLMTCVTSPYVMMEPLKYREKMAYHLI